MKSLRKPLGAVLAFSWVVGCNGPDVEGIVIVSPQDGEEINGPVDIVIEVDRDKETDFEVFIENFNGGSQSGIWPADASVQWANLSQTSGEVEITASVRNREGEIIEDSITVNLNHPMQIELRTPPSAMDEGVFDLSIVSLTIDPLVQGEVFVDGAPFASGTDQLVFPWDTRRELDGVHTLKAEAQRADGTMAEHELEFTSDSCTLPPFDANQATDVVAHSDGTMLVSYPEHILRWHPDNGLEAQWLAAPVGNIIDLADDHDGGAYFITKEPSGSSHLYQVGPDTPDATLIEGTPDEMYKVHATDDGRVYVLGRGPINQQQELHLWTSASGWTIAGEPFTLATPDHGALFVDSSDRLWVGYSGRLYRHQLDANGLIASQDEFMGINAYAFGEDGDGNLLVLAYGMIERRSPEDLSVLESIIDLDDDEWFGRGMAHVKHRPDCHTILVARGQLMAMPSELPGSP
jgi:hypothetical protein